MPATLEVILLAYLKGWWEKKKTRGREKIRLEIRLWPLILRTKHSSTILLFCEFEVLIQLELLQIHHRWWHHLIWNRKIDFWRRVSGRLVTHFFLYVSDDSPTSELFYSGDNIASRKREWNQSLSRPPYDISEAADIFSPRSIWDKHFYHKSIKLIWTIFECLHNTPTRSS